MGRNPRFADMERLLLCDQHEHDKPVCIACCYTDNGRCDCWCHDADPSLT